MNDLPGTEAKNILPSAKDYLEIGKAVEKVKKILLTDSGKYFFVREKSKDFSFSKGRIKDLSVDKEIVGNETFYILEPVFNDLYHSIRRFAQIPPLKDIGKIIAETGMNKDSVVVDAGSGSGACALIFASIAKKVYSFDINEDHLKIAKANSDFIGFENLSIEFNDVSKNIPVKNADIVFFDLPNPYDCLNSAYKSLKMGGFLVCYLPCITEVESVVKVLMSKEDESDSKHKNLSELNHAFVHLKTIELIEREWHVEGRKVRPKSQGLMHSGFLVFCRKVAI